MREFTKSLLSFSWAMSLFPVRQLTNILTPQDPSQPVHKATASFDAVTRATQEQLGDVLKGTFKAGDQLQRGVLDLTFSFLTLEAFNPSRLVKLTSDVMQTSAEAFRQVIPGGTPGSQP